MHGWIKVADSVLYCGISCCVQLIHIRSSLWALVISRTTWNVNSSAQTDFENEEHEVLPTMKTTVAWALLNRQNHMHMHNSSSDDKVPKAILSCDGVEKVSKEVSKYYPSFHSASYFISEQNCCRGLSSSVVCSFKASERPYCIYWQSIFAQAKFQQNLNYISANHIKDKT